VDRALTAGEEYLPGTSPRAPHRGQGRSVPGQEWDGRGGRRCRDGPCPYRCTADEAEYRIVGVEDEEQTYPAFMADPDTCADFASWEAALWIGGLETEPGTVYCAEPV
jgi:hypothetical protein